MESDARLLGRQLGDFTLRECIGQGGFAAVYRSDQLLLGREAVVKVLHHRLSGSEVVLQRFMREARLASRLDHPYAAHVYAFGVEAEDGLAWIAMEFVHGTSLEQWLLDRGPLPLDTLGPPPLYHFQLYESHSLPIQESQQCSHEQPCYPLSKEFFSCLGF
jgi:serine/threonine-protein kinase